MKAYKRNQVRVFRLQIQACLHALIEARRSCAPPVIVSSTRHCNSPLPEAVSDVPAAAVQDTAKTHNLLDQRSYLQYQRKQASRMVTAAAAVLRRRRSLLQLVAVLVTQ